VDQEATNEQGLEELLKTGLETKVFQLQRSDLTYHPKVYLFKSDEKARVITGSANVTKPGLLENTEAATVCEADLSIESDRAFVADVEKSLLNPVDRDATTLTEPLLELLAAEGRIGDEENRDYASASTEQDDEKQESGIDPGATPDVSPPSHLSSMWEYRKDRYQGKGSKSEKFSEIWA